MFEIQMMFGITEGVAVSKHFGANYIVRIRGIAVDNSEMIGIVVKAVQLHLFVSISEFCQN